MGNEVSPNVNAFIHFSYHSFRSPTMAFNEISSNGVNVLYYAPVTELSNSYCGTMNIDFFQVSSEVASLHLCTSLSAVIASSAP